MNHLIQTALTRLKRPRYTDPYTVRVAHSACVFMDEAEEMVGQGLLKDVTEHHDEVYDNVCVFEYTEKGKQYLDMMRL